MPATSKKSRVPAPLPKHARFTGQVANIILLAYDQYNDDFARITQRAKQRFERRDWKGRHADAVMRLDLYERILNRVASDLRPIMSDALLSRPVWIRIRRTFFNLVRRRHDVELTQTFYNSVTRKILHTVGIDREIEFFSLTPPNRSADIAKPVFKEYTNGSIEEVVTSILSDLHFAVPYENMERDASQVAREINLYLWPVVRYGQIDHIDIITAIFFRNKVAYVIGRVVAGGKTVPLVLPLYNGLEGIYVDAALLSESEVSVVFSFAFSYFHVRVDRHDALIEFLQTILPKKPIAELYNSIGYAKHGKTEFYRDLHHFVHESKEKFMIAPGKEGAVMIAFTLPDYGFVFKVIKDAPCFLRSSDITDKRLTRAEVMERYSEVCHRDRVGRLVDTQEFENLKFKRKRFSQALLREFELAAGATVSIRGAYVVISHLYVQRRVTPLPMYLMAERNAERIREVVVDFGFFLRDLAATGIFPYDLFNIWNYGVTSRRRVVLFDYDDVQPLEQTRFREKPPPRDHAEEIQTEEERIATMPDDFFIDEIERYSGIPQPLKGIFKLAHGELFTREYWSTMQNRVRLGEIVDITPYDLSRRFPRPRYDLPTNR